MLETVIPGPGEPDERLVRHYLMALNEGKFLDALNVFSMDARFRDETGRERHGIREIAEAFARHEVPLKVEIEALERQGDAVAVRVRMSSTANGSLQIYRGVFHVHRDRIQSLEIDLVPASRPTRARFAGPA
jgi:hypothetical protein